MRYIILFISVLLISCSPEKRIARIARNHPEVFQKDTIHVKDTFLIEGVKHDTTIVEREFFNRITDTLRIEKERLTVEIYHDTVNNLVEVMGECDSIEVVREIKVPYERVVVEDLNWWQKNNWWIILVVACIITFSVYLRRRN